MVNTISKTGSVAMVIYSLVTALSSILIHDTNQQVPALVSAFYTFLFCMIVYSLCTLHTFKKVMMAKQYWIDILILNVTTAICWIFTFVSLKYIPPELYLFVYLCSMPISACLIHKTRYLKALGLVIGLVLLISTYSANNLYLGVLLAALGGVSGTVYSIYSKKIAITLTTREILSVRFYLVILLAYFSNIYLGDFHQMSSQFYLVFAVIAFVSVIFPLTLFQIGIKHLSVTRALSFLPLASLGCYFMQLGLFHHAINPWQLISSLVISLVMVI
jgi:drug/metabolite transporter (DMT)-like permease